MLTKHWTKWRDDGRLPIQECIYALWRHPLLLGDDEVRKALEDRLHVGELLLCRLRALCASHARRVIALLPRRARALPLERNRALLLPPYLSKLAFICLLEAHTQLQQIVSLRARPLEARLVRRRGGTRLLQLIQASMPEVVPGDAATHDGEGSNVARNVVLEFTILSDEVEELKQTKGCAEYLLCNNTEKAITRGPTNPRARHTGDIH